MVDNHPWRDIRALHLGTFAKELDRLRATVANQRRELNELNKQIVKKNRKLAAYRRGIRKILGSSNDAVLYYAKRTIAIEEVLKEAGDA